MPNKRSKQMKEYYQKTKETQKAYSLNYHKQNRNRVLKRMNEYNKRIPLEKRREGVKKSQRKYPERKRARLIAQRKIEISGVCQICRINLATQRHHPNYNKPLEVVLVCKDCHNKIPKFSPEDYCRNERPSRKVFCQLKKGHNGSHSAVILWE